MKAKYLPQRKRPINKRLVRHLKICVNCGNADVQKFEFGISCEFCGSTYYFDKIDSDEVIGNGTNV